MTLRSSIAGLVVLAATASFGQSSAGPAAPGRNMALPTANSREAVAGAARAKAAANQHVQEMGATIARMKELLKQMRAKAAAAGPKDSMAKANIEMWSLMVDQLDKQYEQLAAMAKAREELEARRQALYKQADEKAAAEAAQARAREANAANSGSSSMPPAESQPVTVPASPQGTSTPAAAPGSTSSPN